MVKVKTTRRWKGLLYPLLGKYHVPRPPLRAIYAIHNLKNQKVYVGCSLRLGTRIRQHRKALKKGTHFSDCFQVDWNADPTQFFFEVLEFIPEDTPYNLRELEQWWIEKLEANNQQKGYNCRSASSVQIRRKRPPR